MTRHEALVVERAASIGLQAAAACHAVERSATSLRKLGEAAVRWDRAAQAVIEAVLAKSEGRDVLTDEDRGDVERVVPAVLRIVR